MSIYGKLEVEIIFDELISKSTISLLEILIDIFFGSPVSFTVHILPSISHLTKKKISPN